MTRQDTGAALDLRRCVVWKIPQAEGEALMTKPKHFGIALRTVSAALGLAAVLLPAVIVVVLAAASAQAQTYSVLYSFRAKHGREPYAGLILRNGSLYGTTTIGGAYGAGAVFKLKANGEEKVLHSFTGGADGANPYAGLVRDSAGNFYGTTANGGAYNAGVVFKVDATGTETVLYSFTGGKDGANPHGSVLRDSAGNLYGTTAGGGAHKAGAVFKVNTTGAETVLYSFTRAGEHGKWPSAGLVRDSAGNLYGTTPNGGAYNAGVAFKLKTNGREKVLYSFTGGADGGWPVAGLVRDSAGNLYGTTLWGGAYDCGVVFKVDATGAETVLYTFTGGGDGGWVHAGLVRDSVGNLYGTTYYGGAAYGDYGAGVVFKLDTTGTETVLYSFTGRGDGGWSEAGLVQDSAGNLYGTTYAAGAYDAGVVFKITPQ
jgi:uncharacterized repeat protein (TIGR03803 family)